MHNSLWNKGRTSIQGQALYVRPAEQTARTIEVRAVLRRVALYKGMPPLRRSRVYPCPLCGGNNLLTQIIPAAKSENPLLSVRPSTENVGGLFLSI